MTPEQYRLLNFHNTHSNLKIRPEPKVPFKFLEEINYKGSRVLFIGLRMADDDENTVLVRFHTNRSGGWDYNSNSTRSDMCQELRNKVKCFDLLTQLYWVDLSVLKRQNKKGGINGSL